MVSTLNPLLHWTLQNTSTVFQSRCFYLICVGPRFHQPAPSVVQNTVHLPNHKLFCFHCTIADTAINTLSFIWLLAPVEFASYIFDLVLDIVNNFLCLRGAFIWLGLKQGSLYACVGCITALFISLLMHISWASSNATECYLFPVILAVKPPASKHFKILAGYCLRSAKWLGIICL